jgi:hypothetical protein
MTTIAANKESIACDLQVTNLTGGYKFKVKTKLFEFENIIFHPVPFVVGYCGDLDCIPDVMEFMKDPTNNKVPRGIKSEFLVLTKDKKLFTFVNPTKWIEVNEPYYAIGSGSTFALGSLASGKSPLEAVKNAGKFDPYTGGGYKEVKFK